MAINLDWNCCDDVGLLYLKIKSGYVCAPNRLPVHIWRSSLTSFFLLVFLRISA